ncbi:hypothetical protein BDB00DRAFT_830807 [Zychaea mexicana]|uniref:uncharacterized protein n=1 Tax=Zychaea mexicana TaxID=64656 RepID=UPI0022FE1C01|nr:uncharacterized protein BDB00DRAFT_830807 [Zychaea mexicana]KAI9492020.1 hypothetical protein BDB00DRAFT_830807 [Zychaea mexicana]
MPAMTMPVQIVTPCPKRPASSFNNQEVQDACHQELRQILSSSTQTINSVQANNNNPTTTALKLPERQHIITRADNPLPQDMSFFTAIQPCLPTKGPHRPRSFSVGDARNCIFIKKSNDLVH